MPIRSPGGESLTKFKVQLRRQNIYKRVTLGPKWSRQTLIGRTGPCERNRIGLFETRATVDG